MIRPGKRFPFDDKYDFAYRPATYWPDLPSEETALAEVKGTVRRRVARSLLEEPDPTAPDGVGDFLLEPDLGEETRELWGAIHPSHMGGEFLPDRVEGEIEIARIDTQSVTGDVYQVLARLESDGRIRYRVVDEYWDEGSRYAVTPEVSDEPLTLGELIDLIDTAEQVTKDWLSGYDVGLFDKDRQFNYDSVCDDEIFTPDEIIDYAEECAGYAAVSSPFYPMLASYYRDRAEAWLLEVRADLESDSDFE